MRESRLHEPVSREAGVTAKSRKIKRNSHRPDGCCKGREGRGRANGDSCFSFTSGSVCPSCLLFLCPSFVFTLSFIVAPSSASPVPYDNLLTRVPSILSKSNVSIIVFVQFLFFPVHEASASWRRFFLGSEGTDGLLSLPEDRLISSKTIGKVNCVPPLALYPSSGFIIISVLALIQTQDFIEIP